MSIKIMTRAWDDFYDGGSKLLIALALADYSDDTAVSWPSVQTLAEKARISPRQVIRITRELQQAGHLAIFPRSNPKHGGPTSNAYILLTSMTRPQLRESIKRLREIGGHPDILSGFTPRPDPAPPDKMSEDPRHGCQGTPVEGDSTPLTQMSHDPSYEPSDEPSDEEEQGAAKNAAPAVPKHLSQEELEKVFGTKVTVETMAIGTPIPGIPAEQYHAKAKRFDKWGIHLGTRRIPWGLTWQNIVDFADQFTHLFGIAPPTSNKRAIHDWSGQVEACIKPFIEEQENLNIEPDPDMATRRATWALQIMAWRADNGHGMDFTIVSPRSLIKSMRAQIIELQRIQEMYGLNYGDGPDIHMVAGFYKGGKKHGSKRTGSPDGSVRKETSDADKRAARVIAARERAKREG